MMIKNERIIRNILIVTFSVLLLVFTATGGYLFGVVSARQGSNITKQTDISTLNEVKGFLEKEFYYGEDTEEYSQKLIDDAIYGMVNAQNDPYTTYMSKEELNTFLEQLSSDFVGIGVRYRNVDGNVFVQEVIKFSPAEVAGLASGDIIIAIDGKKCVDCDEDEIVTRIKGEVGTHVTITVQRNNQIIDFDIIRDTISSTVSSSINGKVGILTITSFSDNTGEEVIKHLDYLVNDGAKSLIIDLRDNTGGYLTTLNKIADCFMDKGDIIMRERDRTGKEWIDYATGKNKKNFRSIVILVNDYSASCSEVFALAMRENCNAILVGETTYGKGVAQLTSQLSNGGAIKYTDCIWLSGKGVSVSKEGIEPDYKVDLHPALKLSYVQLTEDEAYSFDMVDDKIKSCQIMIDFLGYNISRQDGYFDESTVACVKQFQKDLGIDVSGVLDLKTVNCLNSKVIYEWGVNRTKYDTQMKKALELSIK